MNALTINTPEDARYVSLAYGAIKAQRELDKHFQLAMTEDRAYRLGMIATGDEHQAHKYVIALSKNKANNYGDETRGH